MKAECQQRKDSQPTKPESGETSGEGPSTSVLKVKSQKGKTVKIMQVEVDEPAEKKSHEPSPEARDELKRKDKSERKDKPTQQEETENESDTPPFEFEDQMYELMQEAEIMTEYQEMTSEQEEELILQLTPMERAEYREMREYYQLQASETEQGMKLRSAVIKEKARWCTPGLPMDLIQQMVKEESDVTKQDIGQITEVQRQAILQKHEKAPQTMRLGTEKGYYVYVEDEGGVYL